ADAKCRRLSRGKRGDAWNVVADSSAANGFFVVEGFAAERSVDDQIDFAGLDEIDDVGAAFIYLEYAFGFDSCGLKSSGGSARGGELKPERSEFFTDGREMSFVPIIDAEEDGAFAGKALARGELRF